MPPQQSQQPIQPEMPHIPGGMVPPSFNPLQGGMGGFEMMAPDVKGMFVLSSFQPPTDISSAAQMGVSALQTATKGKFAWAWFLIPVVTILAWVISQLAK